MDLRNLENALNNGDFKEQVYRSLEGIYQISKVLNELDIFKNSTGYDLEVTEKIQAIKDALAGCETKKQELEAKINALVNSLEAKKQELEAHLNIQLQSASASEIQNLNEAGNELKNNLVAELKKEVKDNLALELEKLKATTQSLLNTPLAELKKEVKDNLALELEKLKATTQSLLNTPLAELKKEVKDNLALELEKLKATTQSLLNTPRTQGVNLKFLGIYIYGIQSRFLKNQNEEFSELFEFDNIHLVANKSYIVQFSMPYELTVGGSGIYSDKMGEMVLCLKTDSNVYPIANSFYQSKDTINFNWNFNKLSGVYRVNCAFKMPSEEADYKIVVFARWFEELLVNINYGSSSTNGFEMSFLNNARFSNLTTQSLPTDYNNERVFYKHSQALIYEILE
ncbi:hypothetical protein KVC34_01375 [Helicobacter pylori]|nr:hypothetical protein KVC34_01375 [Helicobacter pylori]